MGKNVKVLLVLLLGLLVIGGAYLGYWYYKKNETVSRRERVVEKSRQVVGLQTPEEFTDKFDPVVTSAVYKVLGVNRESGEVELGYYWPKTKSSENVRAKINCAVWDYKIFGEETEVPKHVTRAVFINTIVDNSDRVMMRGNCSDMTCREINQGCEIKLTQRRQDEGI